MAFQPCAPVRLSTGSGAAPLLIGAVGFGDGFESKQIEVRPPELRAEDSGIRSRQRRGHIWHNDEVISDEGFGLPSSVKSHEKKKEGQRKQTKAVVRDLNPTWNEVVNFNVGKKPSKVFDDVLEVDRTGHQSAVVIEIFFWNQILVFGESTMVDCVKKERRGNRRTFRTVA
ncbi:5-methyltetrahydropteroyltriglutamate--homocysteine S-methyltransferase [Sarracenia purpurea var. burkii]